MGVVALDLLPDAVEEFRNMTHKAVDEWIDQLEASFLEDSLPSMTKLSNIFQATRSNLLSDCMKAAIARLYPSYMEQEWAPCPRCDKQVHRKRFEAKKISSLQGRFVLDRPYFYCNTCKHGFYPLDEILELAPERHQYDLQERVTNAAARLPFEEAAELFGYLTGIEIGEHFAHKTLNAIAESATLETVIPETEKIERRISDASPSGAEPPVLVISADGAHAPTRLKAPRKAKRGKGKYQEVKGFRAYLLDSQDRIIHLASWHQIQDGQTIAEALGLLAKRIPQSKVRIALIGDGASWVWNAMVTHFPQSKQILDFYHGFEHLHTVARAHYGEGSQQGREWAEATMIRLCEGEYQRVIANLGRMKPRTPTAKEEIRKLIGYLNNHGPKMNYFEDLSNGYPLGSGAMESANKFISHTRLKRSGAWWVAEMGNAMLRIRCSIYNGTFDSVVQRHIRERSKRESNANERMDE